MEIEAEVPTHSATVYVAGDHADAVRLLREECDQRGLCVTVTPTAFVYTGGAETGVAVGFANYPRFPSEPDALFARAVQVGEVLMVGLRQRTALVVGTGRTRWLTRTPPGSRG